ncbi:hypothetical protein HB780_15660 [Rhizobium lusitanum]|uniref:hypothetical protein n=1 Tax=Rhizobium lusitanum TaxID=293958 RepID=UPI00160DA482|nr:hypothetical protein [Rhizobium lusitanum]QND47158.1 hypothetical protein HB780_15660 [Rhizobium lusitanum]
MLELDDPQWRELQHAYGNASNIPALLRALASSTGLKKGYTDEPWFTLWSSLCHQGDAYTASYAAIPHVVQIAMSTRTPVDFSFSCYQQLLNWRDDRDADRISRSCLTKTIVDPSRAWVSALISTSKIHGLSP